VTRQIIATCDPFPSLVRLTVIMANFANPHLDSDGYLVPSQKN